MNDIDESPPRRLTRAETKARTRALLLDAAARVFARKGSAGASVDEIAESAGFSIGALYSNFASKDEVFLELLATRSGHHLADAGEVMSNASSRLDDRRLALAQLLIGVADKDTDLAPLQAEFWLYAMRCPELRDQLSSQFCATRDTLSDYLAIGIRGQARRSRVPLEAVATVLLALFQGLLQLRRTDPALVPDEMYATGIRWLFAGIAAQAEAS